MASDTPDYIKLTKPIGSKSGVWDTFGLPVYEKDGARTTVNLSQETLIPSSFVKLVYFHTLFCSKLNVLKKLSSFIWF